VGSFLAAVAAFAVSTGEFLAGFLLFEVIMGILMLLISLLVGTSQNIPLGRLRASTGAIQRVGNVLMILVGIGLIYFTIDAGAFQSIFLPS
jgi:cytochrome c biogenesis protein CcdA